MDYKRIYDQLIERGKNRVLEGYVERHHIIPKCMGGIDDITNLVALTPEEHFIAHQLLVKIYPDNHKLIWAVSLLNKRNINNKQYGWIKRKRFGISRSSEAIEKQKRTVKQQILDGRIFPSLTEEHKQKISAGNKGKKVPIKYRSSLEGYILRYGETEGPKLYQEHCKRKDSASLQYYQSKYGDIEGLRRYNERSKQKSELRRKGGGIPHTEESKRKISESKIGKKVKRTAEHNAKIGAANRGRVIPLLTCPHCGKIGQKSNMIRWHFDNCKIINT